MTFTAKEDYGLRACLALARIWTDSPVAGGRSTLQARDIAIDQRIPVPFLEQVLATLRRSGIINATRGSTGGYELARAPEHITSADVLRALSGPLVPAKLLDCAEMGTTPFGDVIRREVWGVIDASLAGRLERVSLQDLLDATLSTAQNNSYGMHI